MITYDSGLSSLPDDIIREIFSLLDVEGLKSCSLTDKALSYCAKPLLHRTLHLTPRSWGPAEPNVPGLWNEFKGLPTLGKRGLLQHTRHLSISLPHNISLLAHELQPHIRYLRTLTNLRSLKARGLDTLSFISKIEQYFGAFLGTLESLELEYPRGNHNRIFYFVCQFPNLRDLRIDRIQWFTDTIRHVGPRFHIATSPPLDGTLELQLGMDAGPESGSMDAQLVLKNLLTLPFDIKFRAIKFSGCTGSNLQLIVDACAQTLEHMEFTWERFGVPPCPRFSFKQHSAFRTFEIKVGEHANIECASGWLSKTLMTITSDVFTQLTIRLPPGSGARDNQVRGWNSVDNALNRLNSCEAVTLVVRPPHPAEEDMSMELIERYFPEMWKDGRALFDGAVP